MSKLFLKNGTELTNVSDWAQTDLAQSDYIANKPNLDEYKLEWDDESTKVTCVKTPNLNFNSELDTTDGKIYFRKDGIFVEGYLYALSKDITLKYTEATTSNPAYLGLYSNDVEITKLDATKFVKDGMLSSAELIHELEGETGTWLKLTWNTDAGNTITYIDVSELADVYTVTSDSEDYLSIENYEVGVKTKSLSDSIGMYKDEEGVWHASDGTTTSDGLTTAADVANVIVENEEVTAAALNDLNVRVVTLVSSKLDTLTAGSNITIDENNVISASGGGSEITDYVVDYSKRYLTFEALEDTTFSFSTNDLQYSIDNGSTWNTLTVGTVSPTIAAGNKILWKQTGLSPISSAGIGTFTATGKFKAYGNIMSLLYGDDFEGRVSLSGYEYVFTSLFYNNTKLIDASNLVLPATILVDECYRDMFVGCTSLTTAPELPATKLVDSCYTYMFSGCESLTIAPELSATTLADECYSCMFENCSALTTAPELPATTLVDSCYNSMFSGCTSLIIAPELPATTLTDSCYFYMFQNCTSLVNAPKLPATTLANECYSGMFKNCTSLTTVPELLATTLTDYCCWNMFYGCTKLNYIKAMFTTTPSWLYTSGWVSGVASSGTFVKSDDATWNVTGIDGVPTGWVVKYDEIKKSTIDGLATTIELPRLFFDTLGQTLPTTKDEGKIIVKVTYTAPGDEFSCYGTLKVQGNSSTAYAKKNWTLKLYEDAEALTSITHDFKNWGKQSKFVLKADWIDLSHARNVVSARLWGDVVASRSDLDLLPSKLTSSPNYGAIDGFVVKGYFNGFYYGRYDLTIPKDTWMTNMDTDNGDVILCGEDYDSACFRSSWEGINDEGWSDELRDNTTDDIKNQLNAFINFVMTSTDEEFVANFSTYADLTSFIDYYIFHYLICGLDAFGKNQILLSYNGGIYYASSYDMDSTFGLYWNGSSFVSTSYRCQEDYETGKHEATGDGYTNLLYNRLSVLFNLNISDRYEELRLGPLSLEHIINRFEEFMNPMSKDLVEEDYASTTANGAFTSMPGQGTNNLQQIRNYIANRVLYVDSNIIVVPVTSINIVGEDSITGTSAQYTIEYTPTDTTQTNVTWEITEGDSYASIDSTGLLTINTTASESSVSIKATSTSDSSVVATKTITVTYLSLNPLTALTIVGDDVAEGDTVYSVTYTPEDTDQPGVIWSITNGTEYATINETTGLLTPIEGANYSPVTITATSSINPSITATKDITVAHGSIIYELENYTLDGTTSPINSEINLWTINNWDIDLTTNLKTQTVNQATILACMNEVASPWLGAVLRTDRTSNLSIEYIVNGDSTLVGDTSYLYTKDVDLTFKIAKRRTSLVLTYPNGTQISTTLPDTMSYTGPLTIGDAYNYNTGAFLGRKFMGTIVNLTVTQYD